jgi:hypothetical protein
LHQLQESTYHQGMGGNQEREYEKLRLSFLTLSFCFVVLLCLLLLCCLQNQRNTHRNNMSQQAKASANTKDKRKHKREAKGQQQQQNPTLVSVCSPCNSRTLPLPMHLTTLQLCEQGEGGHKGKLSCDKGCEREHGRVEKRGCDKFQGEQQQQQHEEEPAKAAQVIGDQSEKRKSEMSLAHFDQ